MISTTLVQAVRTAATNACRRTGTPSAVHNAPGVWRTWPATACGWSATQRGAQRARCVECQRTFTLTPKGPRHGQRFKDQVLAAYQDRMSLRGIHRTFGVCYLTVMRWLGKKSGQLPALVDTLLPSQNGDVLELDELWSFVQAKAQTLWLWVALCRRTRQIVAFTLGNRSQQSAADLRASLPKGYRRRATRSDYWEAYAAAFPEKTHRCCGKADGETNHDGALVWHPARQSGPAGA